VVIILLDLLIPATGYTELNPLDLLKCCDAQQWGRLVSDLKLKLVTKLRISCTNDSTNQNIGAFGNPEQNKSV
jgi:hypothetical protein